MHCPTEKMRSAVDISKLIKYTYGMKSDSVQSPLQIFISCPGCGANIHTFPTMDELAMHGSHFKGKRPSAVGGRAELPSRRDMAYDEIMQHTPAGVSDIPPAV